METQTVLAGLAVLAVLAMIAVLVWTEGASTCPRSSESRYRPYADWILALGEENFHGGAFTSWFSPSKLDGEWEWYPHLTGVLSHQPTKFTFRWDPALNRIRMIPSTGGRAWLARWADDHRLLIQTGTGPIEAQVFQTRGCTTPRIFTPIGTFSEPGY